jgi:hypothetical protein
VCSLLLILALVAPETPTKGVTAMRLDGASVVGELQGWVDQQIALATAKGVETLATDELVSLSWSSASAAGDTEEAVASTVELTDGTVLPATDIRLAGGRLSMTLLNTTSTHQKPLTVPVKQVVAVRLKTLKPAAAEQWQEIREQERTSDVLLVANRGGENLDYVEGVIGEITADEVEFKVEGEQLSLKRDRVVGLVFFRRGTDRQPDPRCVLHGRNGLRVSASQVRLAENVLHIKTMAGVDLDWPLADVEFADFSAGKIRYISDIAESTMRWTPLIALPQAASQAAEYGQPRRDRSAYGGPLTLSVSDGDSPPATGQLQIFSKGLALRSRTELIYRLPAGFGRFTATAGIEPATSTTGNVQLSIYGDDRPLFEAAISGQQPPREIELDIAGVKRLKIVVDFGKNLDTGDWLNLCDARLVK